VTDTVICREGGQAVDTTMKKKGFVWKPKSFIEQRNDIAGYKNNE
jgi:hypothetical protein